MNLSNGSPFPGIRPPTVREAIQIGIDSCGFVVAELGPKSSAFQAIPILNALARIIDADFEEAFRGYMESGKPSPELRAAAESYTAHKLACRPPTPGCNCDGCCDPFGPEGE